MTDRGIPMAAPLIEAYLKAAEASDADEILVRVLEQLVEPQVTSLIRQKLHVTLNATDVRRENQDALELVGEIKTLIVAKLAKLRTEPHVSRIDNFNAYVQAVMINTTNHYLRQKYPVRLRLKNQIRYVLSHDKRFALWSDLAGEWVCGLGEWKDRGMQISAFGIGQHEALRRTDPAPEMTNLSQLLSTVFLLSGAPMRFGDLVSTVYEARRASEPVEVPEEKCYELGGGEEIRTQNKLEHTAVLGELWAAINEMPLRHRCALLLNLKAPDGEGLITFLPITRVASICDIARCLEMSERELAAIWAELPWDDKAIAEHLGLSRQQVINLRQSARARLKRKMKSL